MTFAVVGEVVGAETEARNELLKGAIYNFHQAFNIVYAISPKTLHFEDILGIEVSFQSYEEAKAALSSVLVAHSDAEDSEGDEALLSQARGLLQAADLGLVSKKWDIASCDLTPVSLPALQSQARNGHESTELAAQYLERATYFLAWSAFQMKVRRESLLAFHFGNQIIRFASKHPNQLPTILLMLNRLKESPWDINAIADPFLDKLTGDSVFKAGLKAEFQQTLEQSFGVIQSIWPGFPLEEVAISSRERTKFYGALQKIETKMSQNFKAARRLKRELTMWNSAYPISPAYKAKLEEVNPIFQAIEDDASELMRTVLTTVSPSARSREASLDSIDSISSEGLTKPSPLSAAQKEKGARVVSSSKPPSRVVDSAHQESRFMQGISALKRHPMRVLSVFLCLGGLASLPITWPLLLSVLSFHFAATIVSSATLGLGAGAFLKSTASQQVKEKQLPAEQQGFWQKAGRFLSRNKGKIIVGGLIAASIAAGPFGWGLLLGLVSVKVALTVVVLFSVALEVSLFAAHRLDEKRAAQQIFPSAESQARRSRDSTHASTAVSSQASQGVDSRVTRKVQEWPASPAAQGEKKKAVSADSVAITLSASPPKPFKTRRRRILVALSSGKIRVVSKIKGLRQSLQAKKRAGSCFAVSADKPLPIPPGEDFRPGSVVRHSNPFLSASFGAVSAAALPDPAKNAEASRGGHPEVRATQSPSLPGAQETRPRRSSADAAAYATSTPLRSRIVDPSSGPRKGPSGKNGGGPLGTGLGAWGRGVTGGTFEQRPQAW